MSVSYTHLDVYKRQSQYKDESIASQWKQEIKDCYSDKTQLIDEIIDYVSVSYTHLDVYKRQAKKLYHTHITNL